MSGQVSVVPEATPPAADKRRKLLIAGAAALLVAVLAGGLWFAGLLPVGHKAAPKATAASGQINPNPIYVEMPDIVANLNSSSRRQVFIKVKPRIEVARPEDKALLEAAMPRLEDMFQTYLREMRPEELKGAAGTYRLREELIARANIVAAPARVLDVLFTELLVQ